MDYWSYHGLLELHELLELSRTTGVTWIAGVTDAQDDTTTWQQITGVLTDQDDRYTCLWEVYSYLGKYMSARGVI